MEFLFISISFCSSGMNIYIYIDILFQVKLLLIYFCTVMQPNCIILAISPANQDLATSDAIKISREVDPRGRIYKNSYGP